MPKVRGDDSAAFVSVFVEIVGGASLADGWSRSAKATVAIENVQNASKITRSELLAFNSECLDNGWNEFAPLTKICEEGSGFLPNGQLVVSVRFQDVRRKN